MSNNIHINYAQTVGTREYRGKAIAEKQGQIIRINDQSYKVRSQSNDTLYDITHTEIGWKCTCPDHMNRGVQCKHIYAVEISFGLRKEIEKVRIEPIVTINTTSCLLCGSGNIVKDGLRHNKYGDIQVFHCKNCLQHFSLNLGFEKMKANPKIVTMCQWRCNCIFLVNH